MLFDRNWLGGVVLLCVLLAASVQLYFHYKIASGLAEVRELRREHQALGQELGSNVLRLDELREKSTGGLAGDFGKELDLELAVVNLRSKLATNEDIENDVARERAWIKSHVWHSDLATLAVGLILASYVGADRWRRRGEMSGLRACVGIATAATLAIAIFSVFVVASALLGGWLGA